MTDVRMMAGTTADRLRAALGEFFAAWKRKHAPSATRTTRQFAGLATLVLIGSIIATGYWFDVDGVWWGRSLSPPVIEVFQKITRLGESG